MNVKKQTYNYRTEDHRTEIIKVLLNHAGETTFSAGQILDLELSEVDPQKEPKRHKTLTLLSCEVFELWESLLEAAERYDFIDFHSFREKEV
jgi:hypothetical protein